MDGIPPGFTRAYALMPALVAALANGNEDDRWTVIRTVTGLDAAARTAECQPDSDGEAIDNPDRMTSAIALLNTQDVDLVADFTTPIMDGAFMAGAAYACYVLLKDGGR
jgi:hypothetical protein